MKVRIIHLLTWAMCGGMFGCDNSTNTVDACGDGFVDPAEECDRTDLQGQSCGSLGHYNLAGTLGCTNDCEFDRTECGGRCGDGVLEGERGEQCDGENLAGATCDSQGFSGGSLGCDSACHFDTSACESRCGDGVVTAPNEDCEGDDLAGGTCQSEGFYQGTLRCGDGCRYDTTDCDQQCGDGSIQDLFGEVCDGILLDGQSCEGLGYHGGQLLCAADCRSLDETPCQEVGRCGDSLIQEAFNETCDATNLGGQTCLSLGYDRGELACKVDCTLDEGACILHFARLAPGGYHTCSIRSNDSVWCWGNNNFGSVGDGTTTHRLVPTAVSTLGSGVTALAAGELHTCALKTDGSVWCWGKNDYGQLGDNSTTHRQVPTAVSALSSGVTALAAGDLHTCAIKTDGSAWCWGRNEKGQLGDGTSTQSLVPVAVDTLVSGVVAMDAGTKHTCALKTNGSVWCWGDNFHGQVGDNTTTSRLVPTEVSGLTAGVTALTSGSEFNCAVKVDGSAWCWGRGDTNQLGTGTTSDRLVPTAVTEFGSGVSQVTAGDTFTCARKTDGSVWCWGNNTFSQIGDGTTTSQPLPTAVSGLTSDVSQVIAGRYHACAVKTDGSAWCWGRNENGAIGDGTVVLKSVPTQVLF
ncbi:hypothetical protein KKC22_09700 [Myxococcota bacterium]|nr:hypothetical protein [Myxococcota bacterium]